MRGHSGKKFFLIYALLCAVMLSSCKSGGSISPSSDTAVSVSVTAPSDTAVPGSAPSGETVSEGSSEAASEITSGSVSDTSETETSVTETSSAADISETEASAAAVSVTEETVPSETASSSEESSSEMLPEPVTEASAAAETASAVHAEIIIPDVKVPLASGVSVFSEEKAELDYSNAADGYISVLYSGSSDQAKLRIANGGVQYDHDISADGTRDFIPLMGSGGYTVKVYEHVSGKNFAPILSGEFNVSMKNENDTYLYPNKYVNFGKDSDCVKKAAELCAGKSGDVEKIAAVFTYIAENISYDKQLAATVNTTSKGGNAYIPDPDRTLSSGKGICFDYASLFAAMCRSGGIPARLVIGYADPNIYHAWNEVYTDETGWITPELFLKKKGYNIADATFYAGNSDKKKISEYISDDGNYAAVYRY